MAGGVSSSLSRSWDGYGSKAKWWHLQDRELKVAPGADGELFSFALISEELSQGHYHYCNEFLWPVMHDLPQYARYLPSHREQYHRFNEIVSRSIAQASTPNRLSHFFVQDYQLALMPQFLRRSGLGCSTVFWHIPWPQSVRKEHVTPIIQIAKGLLAAKIIGFHVQAYCDNFMRFVSEHLPEYAIDPMAMSIRYKGSSFARKTDIPRDFAAHERAHLTWNSRAAQLVVAPLGLDFQHWSSMADSGKAAFWLPLFQRKPYILSVDRADYTKGVSERLRAINCFFEKYPQWRGEVSFVQICGRSRSGISAFDNYWQECKQLERQLVERWQTAAWSPSLWLESTFSAEQLSLLYRNAAIMLVNPLKDGLNLTAKEFVACQGQKPGVLALARGAGAWQELHGGALEVVPTDLEQMSDAIARGLSMKKSEKLNRMKILTSSVRANRLEDWWRRFSTIGGATAATGESQTGILREIS